MMRASGRVGNVEKMGWDRTVSIIEKTRNEVKGGGVGGLQKGAPEEL